MADALVGRDPVLAVAQATVEGALAGSGQLLLFSGEPGIGKTAMLAELARDAAHHGARVLWGAGWSGGGAPVYWPWTQVLRGIADGTDPAQLGSADLGPASSLVAAEPAVQVAERALDARFRLFDAVAQLLTRLAKATPLVVVLDDLQWADEPSLRLLDFVVRQLSTSRVLVLAAFRDDEAHPLLRSLAGIGQLLPLPGLAPADIPALMAAVAGSAVPAPPGPGLVERVWRRSAGNPFFVRELTRLLLAQGGWTGEAAPDPPVPDTVRDALERRLARLSQPCVELLAVAALAGAEFRAELLDAVLTIPGSSADLLAEAVRARVLAPTLSPGGEHRFVHELFRETVLAGLPAARRAALCVGLGRALEARRAAGAVVPPSELAAHFVAAGTAAVAPEAVRYSTAAAREATARLGHEDACRHYERALLALELCPDRMGADQLNRTTLLLEAAAARDRSGDARGARIGYRQAAGLARRAGDPVGLAGAAIGVHSLGARSGTVHDEALELLSDAAATLPTDAAALRAQVLASLSRELRHSRPSDPAQRSLVAAEQAVELANAQDDAAVLAFALLALHDAVWAPGSGRRRLTVLADMLDAAQRAGDRELVAQAHLLRAAALIELGDPAGLVTLSNYTQQASELGHARGRWGSLTRRATLAVLTGRFEEAAALAEQGLALGRQIGQVDAHGVHGTLCFSLAVVCGPITQMDTSVLMADPLRPLLPLVAAGILVAAGQIEEAHKELAGFVPDLVPVKYDLELLALLAAVTAAAGSTHQREHAYDRLRPHAGLHVVVGGCASYSGAVDHHLGILAAALGRTSEAAGHLRAAVTMHDRLGATPWAERSRAALAALEPAEPARTNMFRLDGPVWTLSYRGDQAHLPDVKGLHDLAVLLAAPGRPVHVFTLLGRDAPPSGADPVLDEQARRSYRSRLAELDAELAQARAWQDLGRSERAAMERDALVRELTAATGLGRRPRRLGDETERARKTVTARIRDALGRIERELPALGAHLRATISTGTCCTYTPIEPTPWRL